MEILPFVIWSVNRVYTYYKQNIYFYNEITRDISGILQAINTFFFNF